jgi:hypothetical protein
VDGKPIESWQELRWRLIHAQGADASSSPRRATETRAIGHAALPLGALAGADWEQNPMGSLGLKQDLGAPVVDRVLPGKPAERGGLRGGDRIVAVDGVPVRSPSDVAAITNERPASRWSSATRGAMSKRTRPSPPRPSTTTASGWAWWDCSCGSIPRSLLRSR